MLTMEKQKTTMVESSPIPEGVFKQGLLDKVQHDRLLADLSNITKIAGIPPHFVWSRLSQFCTGDDFDWVRHIRSSQSQGLCYLGKQTVPVEDKMMAITGACLRNYIDARVMTVQEVITRMKEDDMPMPTVLAIPNFCSTKANSGDLPTWQSSSLLGLLYTRMSRNLKTVIYISSRTSLDKAYGDLVLSHIDGHFTYA